MIACDRRSSLYFGSPPPSVYDYQISIVDCLFDYTEEELKKESKRRLKLYKQDWKKYYKYRKKELKELSRKD